MSWKQKVTPNLDPYVYDPNLLDDWYGECLATVRAAFNAPYSGPCAWAGWTDYTQIRHEDRNWPVGVYFPIWFSGYGGLGHVAIAYINSNGSMNIWTSPYKHVPYFYTGYTNVDTLAKAYLLDGYVGWSEDIAGMRIIENVADAPAPVAAKYSIVETYTDKYVKLNKQPTCLWGMNWDADYMTQNPVETHNAGEVWAIADRVLHEDGEYYYRRPGQVDGFNVVDCDDYIPPAPSVPSPPPENPTPPVEPDPLPAPEPVPAPPVLPDLTNNVPTPVGIPVVIAKHWYDFLIQLWIALTKRKK